MIRRIFDRALAGVVELEYRIARFRSKRRMRGAWFVVLAIVAFSGCVYRREMRQIDTIKAACLAEIAEASDASAVLDRCRNEILEVSR
jgi:hypothetical protein